MPLPLLSRSGVRFLLGAAACVLTNCEPAPAVKETRVGTAEKAAAVPGRGIPTAGPWVSFYGTAAQMGDLQAVAARYRVINLDADPDVGNFTREQIRTLRADGRNRVLSYLNLGAVETWRRYWREAPPGLTPAGRNPEARLSAYEGYPDEVWMDPGEPRYQALILEHVAPRLAAQGVDGFFFDNLEVVEHPGVPARARQGGLDLVRRLRERLPGLVFVMQNATGDTTRLGKTGGLPFAALLDGVSHEAVYAPTRDPGAERELLAWRDMRLRPSGRPFWIGTEDYAGAPPDAALARRAYAASRARGFSPYVSDESAGQERVYDWPF